MADPTNTDGVSAQTKAQIGTPSETSALAVGQITLKRCCNHTEQVRSQIGKMRSLRQHLKPAVVVDNG